MCFKNIIKIVPILIFFMFLFGWNLIAQAELNGYIENQSSLKLHYPVDFINLNNTLGLKINLAAGDNCSAFANMDLEHTFGNKDISGYILQSGDTDNYFGINLKEIYINMSLGIFDIRVGKQIVSWGKVDAFAPTDNINPTDYRGFDILDSSNMKIAIPMLKIDAYLFDDYLHIEGIYIPLFFSSIYPDPDSDWAFYTPPFPETMLIGGSTYNVDSIEQNSAVYPAKTIWNYEAGLRVGSSVGGYDFSCSYFFTWDDNPTIHQELTLDFPAPGDITITTTPKYHRLHIIGLDFAKAIGDFGLRAESAFFITEDTKGVDSDMADPCLKWAIGADYSFLNDYNINLQVSEEIQNFTVSRDVETQTSIIGALSAVFLEERLRVELGGMYGFEEKDYLIGFTLDYDFSDSLSLSSGVQIFGGRKHTQFGNFDENDCIFIKAVYSF